MLERPPFEALDEADLRGALRPEVREVAEARVLAAPAFDGRLDVFALARRAAVRGVVVVLRPDSGCSIGCSAPISGISCPMPCVRA